MIIFAEVKQMITGIRKQVFVLILLLSCSTVYSQKSTYLIKKGETLWSVSKAMLNKKGNTKPTNTQIYSAMEIIASANGCSSTDDCVKKYFSNAAIAKGSKIVIPDNLKKSDKSTSSKEGTAGEDGDLFDFLLSLYSMDELFKTALNDPFLGVSIDNNENKKPASNEVYHASTKNVNTNSPSAKLFSQKQMTVEQMVDHPLGFLSDNSKYLTFARAKKELEESGAKSNYVREGATIAFFPQIEEDEIYDLTWKGNKPWSAEVVWANGKMSLYQYSFNIKKDLKASDMEKIRKIDLGKEIVNTLTTKKGIVFADDPDEYHPDNTYYFMKGQYGSKTIIVSICAGVGDTIRLSLEISDYSN